MKTSSIVSLFFFLLPSLVFSQGEQNKSDVDLSSEKIIREIIKSTGMKQIGGEVLDAYIEKFKKQNPKLKNAFWKNLKNEIDVDDFTERLIPVYNKYYSAEELKELRAFYLTPLGKKVIEESPKLYQDSVIVGEDWGRIVTEKMADEIEEEMKKEK